MSYTLIYEQFKKSKLAIHYSVYDSLGRLFIPSLYIYIVLNNYYYFQQFKVFNLIFSNLPIILFFHFKF